jgi:hypothetical protein
MFTVVDSVVEFYLDSLIVKELAFWRKLKIKRTKGHHGHLTVKVRKAGQKVWTYLDIFKKNLLTNGGRDFIHAQVYTNTSAGTQGANYVAVTTDATAPAATDTTLTTEIASGGLTRALAAPSHTAGTNTSTLTITFTSSATFTAVQKAGTFNAATVGIMMHENTFTSTNLVSGDQIALTWTMTLG